MQQPISRHRPLGVSIIAIGLIIPFVILLYFLVDRNVREAFRI